MDTFSLSHPYQNTAKMVVAHIAIEQKEEVEKKYIHRALELIYKGEETVEFFANMPKIDAVFELAFRLKQESEFSI